MTSAVDAADALFRRFVATGDADAFGAFFDATADGLFAAALRLAKDAAAADDAVQETFIAALDLVDRFDTARPVRPWLLGILHNKLRETRRGETRLARRAVHATQPTGSPDPLDEVARLDDRDRVREHLDALPEPYREVAVLRWRYGLETGEIADATGRAPGTVRSQLHRARERLRGALGLAIVAPAGVTCPGHLLGIRTTVMRSAAARGAAIAAAAAVATSTGVTATTLLGVLIMKRIVVAAILLLALLALVVTGVAVWPAASQPAETEAAGAIPHAAPVRRHVNADAGVDEAPAPPTPVPAGPSERAIRGIVRGPGGTVVADAEILVVGDAAGRRAEGSSAGARSDAGGAFVIEPPDTAPLFRVVATSSAHAPFEQDGVRPGTRIEITLAAGATLRGRIVGDDGRPVAGAHVEFVQAWEGAEFVRQTTSGPSGAYTLPALPLHARDDGGGGTPRAYVHVTADGWAPLTERLAGHPDLTRPLDLRLGHGARIEGVVLDAESGSPVAGAEIVAWSSERRADSTAPASATLRDRNRPAAELGRTTTDSDGRFAFAHVPTGGRNPHSAWGHGRRGPILGGVAARADGYVLGADEIPVVRDGDVVDATIRLWRGAVVTGRVLDGTGAPLPKARVFELTMERHPGHVAAGILGATPQEVVTDAEGRYRLDGVPAPTGAPAPARVIGRPPGATTIPGGTQILVYPVVEAGQVVEAPDIVLGASQGADPRVVLVVTDTAGTPIWGASATWANWGRPVTTDRDGRVEFVFTHGIAGKPPTPQRLVVRAPGFAPTVTESFVPSRDGTIEVGVTPAPAETMTGGVTWRDGSPAAGVAVTVASGAVPADLLFPSDGLPLGVAQPSPPELPYLVQFGQATTDDDGTFVAHDLPVGPYTVRAAIGASNATVTVVDGHDIRIVLPGNAPPPPITSAVLEVVVTDARGDAVPQAWVSVTGHAHPPRLPVPGTFRFEGLGAGSAQVAVGARGFRTNVRQVTLVANETARLEMGLMDSASLRGTVRAAEGVDTELLRVSAFWTGQGPSPVVSTNVRADGRYLLEGLGSGRFRIEVGRVQTGAPFVVLPEAVEVDVTAGDVHHLDLRAQAGGLVQVRVPAAWTNDRGVPVHATDGGERVLARSALSHRWTTLWLPCPTGEVVVVVEREAGAESRRVTVAIGAGTIADFTSR